MSRYQDDEARRLQIRVAALTVAQVGPFTAFELCRFLYPDISPHFDPTWSKRLSGLKRSLNKLVGDDDLTITGDYYALKRTAQNGLVCAVLPEAQAGSTIAAPTREQLMGSGRRVTRIKVAA